MGFTPTQTIPNDVSKPITTVAISVWFEAPSRLFTVFPSFQYEDKACNPSFVPAADTGIPDNDVRQCLIYDSPDRNARLIGIEYMIAPHLFEALPQDERRLWHSHVYEVKSGMLVMPNRVVPESVWEAAETKEMEEVIKLYGKTYHLWQTDRGDALPLGEPKLMMSYTADGQLDSDKVEKRDAKFAVSYKKKQVIREGIECPRIHPDADSAWSSKN
ncbi:hypothetical protein E4U42_001362 [Claviceps africana]|uniref:DUF1264 domain protein n=1 Tax=Claviceps africana TaxID=83212 RepID=A0A8K0JIS9_9HYPO|nr:hypothetical protein E4U42_001362 [Claviceps africana]